LRCTHVWVAAVVFFISLPVCSLDYVLHPFPASRHDPLDVALVVRVRARVRTTAAVMEDNDGDSESWFRDPLY
jgi:hypothetical protein